MDYVLPRWAGMWACTAESSAPRFEPSSSPLKPWLAQGLSRVRLCEEYTYTDPAPPTT
jgi:hypothetical protein